ncbi:LysE family transporter [Accumulibacter sp.]|uniref:LysE family translocator n=1 Tax=Accumulibacter sp. TaxID=2053492 RepID=UPI00159B7590|nr:LysE family transporter [Accumulibacter sp.]QKS31438.1 MAG: LysE family transporter [Candidatus Accumulibacter similis]
MDALLFLKAGLIGLSIAAPVGPIGLLCIQRTLAHGARIGFVSGLGAAVADGVYGAVGAFGLAAVTQFFVTLALPLAVGGAAFLGWMGVQLYRTVPPARSSGAADDVGAWRAFASVFALTLTNPMTILSFIAVFATIGGGDAATTGTAAVIMVLGVFCGSALWWLALASAIAAIRQRIGPRVLQAINRTAGTFLLGFAIWQLITVLR